MSLCCLGVYETNSGLEQFSLNLRLEERKVREQENSNERGGQGVEEKKEEEMEREGGERREDKIFKTKDAFGRQEKL